MSPRPLLFLAITPALAGRTSAADDPARRGFDPDPARLAFSLDGGFTAETAAAAPRGTWRLASIFDVAGGLLVLEQGNQRQDLLVSRGVLHLMGGWSLGRVELAAHLPIALWQNSDLSPLTAQGVTGALVENIASTTLGDLRLGAKLPILDAGAWPVGLAALIDLRLPTGNPQAFMSDGFSAVPSLVVTRKFGRVRVDAQAGYQIRRQGQYAQLVVHDGFVYVLGGSVDLPKVSRLDSWKAIAEIDGGWPRGEDLSTDRYRPPLSARAGVRALLSPPVSVEAGLGPGIGPVRPRPQPRRALARGRWGRPPRVRGPPPFAGPIPHRD